MWYFIGWSFFLVFFKAYLSLKVIGRENIPKRGAFIFASNHSSYLDPILLGVSAHRSLNYMAQEDLFKRPFLGWALRKVRSFPVKRDESDFRAIKDALRKLAEGNPLVIFPEGTRSKDGSLKSAKPGIGFIGARSGVPVVPAYIKGAFEALPRGAASLRRRPVSVYIGMPVNFDKTYFNTNTRNRDAYQEMSEAVMRSITRLKEKYEGCVG